MINIVEINKVKLGKNQFTSITTDKKYIYLTYPKIKRIYKLDYKFNVIEKICVPYCIKCLTYDCKNKVFFALVNNSRQIQVYDNKFINIGIIPIPNSILRNENIKSISFRQDSEELILGFKSYIAAITADGKYSIITKNNIKSFAYTGTENINHININTCISNSKQYINFMQGTKTKLTLPLNGNGKVIDLCLICSQTGFYLYILRNIEHVCSFIDILEIKNLENNISKKEHKKSNKKCDKIDCKLFSDVLESIALIDAALSDIISAESKKLQKVLCKCNNIKTILKTNDSINETITNATLLEQVIFQKLQKIMSVGIDCPVKCKKCNNSCKKSS